MQPRTAHPRAAAARQLPAGGHQEKRTHRRGIARPPEKNQFLLYGPIPAGRARDRFGDLREEEARIEDLVPGIRPGDYFLVVDGDSMRDAGLLHGQHVVIRPGLIPRNGDICAVWVDGLGNTLKRVYFKNEETVTLMPANPGYAPMDLPADQIRIQGVLVAALAVRSFRGKGGAD